MQISHPFPPVCDANAQILILGSFPSVRSRADHFYYAHPQNRFWRVLAAVFAEEIPTDEAQKRSFLARNRIALWDVAATCEVEGSADSSLRRVIPNDIRPLLAAAPIRHVYTNGRAATALYERHIQPIVPQLAHTPLPSTSPANAAWRLDPLITAWSVIRGEET